MLSNRNLFEVWTWMASFGFLAMLQQFIPREYIDSLRRKIRIRLQRLTPYIFCNVHEFNTGSSARNSLYQDVKIYLGSLKAQGAQRVDLCKPKGSKDMTFDLAHDERTLDTFDGSELEWVYRIIPRQRPMYSFFDSGGDEKGVYTLKINKNDKERVLDAYMKHIEKKASEMRLAARDLLLYTNNKSRDNYSRFSGPWQSVPFLHPANFDTLALDGELKSSIIKDLEHFAANEEYYKRIGKAWKRGYLLFGPPGTGKSSMIGAIANKMRYDVYDLELTEVGSNAELRKLLLNTSNKSVIVIEDIDCSLELSGQRKKKSTKTPAPAETAPGPPNPPDEQSIVTLSGLLNFVDGLWSCCGQERIFIFTTNFKEKLDPALLRAGRMDKHIHLSYCTFSAFKTLAKNYLGITEHEFFDKVESAFVGTFMTPAEVGEVIIQNQEEDIDVTLARLIEALGEHRVDPSTLKTLNADEEEEVEVSSESQEEQAAQSTQGSAQKTREETLQREDGHREGEM